MIFLMSECLKAIMYDNDNRGTNRGNDSVIFYKLKQDWPSRTRLRMATRIVNIIVIKKKELVIKATRSEKAKCEGRRKVTLF